MLHPEINNWQLALGYLRLATAPTLALALLCAGVIVLAQRNE